MTQARYQLLFTFLAIKSFSPKCSAAQCSTAQCSTAQFSAEQCSTVQCSTVQHSAVQCSATKFSGMHLRRGQLMAKRYRIVLHGNGMQTSSVQCTLYSTVHCNAVKNSAVYSDIQCSAV